MATEDPAEGGRRFCSIREKEVVPGQARYSITENHYDCQFPNGYKSPMEEFEERAKEIDATLASLGLKRKRVQAALGTGAPTLKLIAIIEASAKEHFGTEDVGEVKINLPPPVWRQHRFDVQRVEGSMLVRGRRVMFASWHPVTELIKCRRVKFNDDDILQMGLSPDYETRRSRGKREACS